MTDYSCIIKSPKKNILYIKNKNKYYSKHPAPTGWKESLLKIFTKENINFDFYQNGIVATLQIFHTENIQI